jgi:hypothetical protein
MRLIRSVLLSTFLVGITQAQELPFKEISLSLTTREGRKRTITVGGDGTYSMKDDVPSKLFTVKKVTRGTLDGLRLHNLKTRLGQVSEMEKGEDGLQLPSIPGIGTPTIGPRPRWLKDSRPSFNEISYEVEDKSGDSIKGDRAAMGLVSKKYWDAVLGLVNEIRVSVEIPERVKAVLAGLTPEETEAAVRRFQGSKEPSLLGSERDQEIDGILEDLDRVAPGTFFARPVDLHAVIGRAIQEHQLMPGDRLVADGFQILIERVDNNTPSEGSPRVFGPAAAGGVLSLPPDLFETLDLGIRQNRLSAGVAMSSRGFRVLLERVGDETFDLETRRFGTRTPDAGLVRRLTDATVDSDIEKGE